MKRLSAGALLLIMSLFVAVSSAAAVKSPGYLELNGEDRYMAIPQSPAFNIPAGGTMTITLRVTLDHDQEPMTRQTLVGSRVRNYRPSVPQSSYDFAGFEIYNVSQTETFYNSASVNYPANELKGSHINSKDNALRGGRECHVAFVYDGVAGVMSYYVDGVLLNDGTATTLQMAIPCRAPVLVGCRYLTDSQTPFSAEALEAFAHGFIDDLRFYADALTADEVMADSRSATPLKSPRLIAAYDFNDIDGRSVPDISGNGHDGELKGDSWPEYEGSAPMPDNPDVPDVTVYKVTIVQPDHGVINLSTADGPLSGGATVNKDTEITVKVVPDEGYKVMSVLIDGRVLDGDRFVPEADCVVSARIVPVGTANRDYCYPDMDVNRTDLGITSLTIRSGDSSIEAVQELVTGRPVYSDRTDLVLVAKPGQTVNITPKGKGEGTHSFFFVDFNGDGVFTPAFGLTTHPAPGSELVSFDRMNRGEGYFDSADKSYPDGNTDLSAIVMPPFEILSTLAPGTYRMRYVNNMVSYNPCGISTYQSIADVGGSVIDLSLRIVSDGGPEHTVTIATNSPEVGTARFVSPVPDEEGAQELTTTERVVTVKAEPIGNAVFVRWTEADGTELSTDAVYTYRGESDVKLTAWFGYAVSWTLSEGGRVGVTAAGEPVESDVVVLYGEKIRINLYADSGFDVAGLTANGRDIELSAENSASLAVTSPLHLHAEFTRIVPRLTLTSEGHGSVAAYTAISADGKPDGAFLRTGSELREGDMMHLFIYPDNNRVLIRLRVNDGETSRDYTPDLLDTDASGVFMRLPVEVRGSVIVHAIFSTESASIPTVEADGATVEYYDLHGRRVAPSNLTPGIYIVREGNRTRKILIR